MNRFRTNSMIFLVAVGLSVVLFYFTENSSFFSASILSLQDSQTMKDNSRDVAYKNEKNILDVFVSDTIKDVSYISVSIIYDQQDVEINLDKIKPQTEYEIISQTSGNILLKFTNFASNFDYGQSLFELPFSGKEPAILLSESTALLLNGENKSLSIGFLNLESGDNYHGVLSRK